jgi:hypothetical protein
MKAERGTRPHNAMRDTARMQPARMDRHRAHAVTRRHWLLLLVAKLGAVA